MSQIHYGAFNFDMGSATMIEAATKTVVPIEPGILTQNDY
jgi:hypothetical protein